MQRTWRILSIDGGGIRGIIPATIMAFIEERTGKPISQLFDLIAGTSTGGILALGLTKPDADGSPVYTARNLCELYEDEIPHIFENPQPWLGNLLSPKYRSFAFQRILQSTFGSTRLKSALTDVLIPCYDIEHRVPYMFKSRSATMNSARDFLMRNVALAASASPTLFHPVNFEQSSARDSICLVDGGVFANNPASCAFAEIKSRIPSESDKYFVVSIGTGKLKCRLSDEMLNLWGYVQWSRPMLELVMESNSESVHEQMKHLLPSIDNQRYYRLQVDLTQDVSTAMDNASQANMKAINHAAKAYCADSRNEQELNEVCEILVRLSEQQANLQPILG